MKRFTGASVAGVLVLALLAAVAGDNRLTAQQPAAGDRVNTIVDPRLYDGLTFRALGFSRGGRATAVAGVPSDPLTYYFGSTGGGVWKTTDAGLSWQPISDGFFEAGSIGAIAVADSDPNVIYVGTGSACPRGNISPGVGMYKSTDAGKTWKHIGLRNAGQIGRLRVHPRNHDLVYAAVLGNMFGPSAERGIFRSKDGGQNWEKVLYVDERTGAVDLSMDATNPRILYAAQWTTERKPWTIESGSLVGGIFKTADGGDTWKKLANGLPTDVLVGRIGVSVSPANPNRVWAQVEAANDRGGVFRSDNAGETWHRINSQRMLQQRAWYYTHIIADPVNPETVYALNTGFYRSTDGGRTFQSYEVPHGDNHDLWVNPRDNRIMINANDGGANVSFTGATSWTDQMGQPTAEFYRITVDSRFPPRVYGAQQDNSTASVPSVGFGGGGGGGGGRGAADFYAVGGGESGHIAVDPRNPNVVYAGSYGGTITRVDVGLGLSESVRPYPDLETGQRALDMKYRFQWNAPIRLSPHNADVLYFTSQMVHRSKDQGKTWEVISPDLTTNDKSKQDFSGGEGITRDSTGVEVFCTIFAFEESAKVPGLLWAGSDDGLVHVSRDDGKSWNNVTPADMPKTATVNNIDLSAHDQGRVHVSAYKYRENDFTPYIFQTSDYGKTWKRLTTGTNGIPANHFVRVVKEDPVRRGLLYAGTEFGLYASFDDGAHWQRLQLDLPVTPVTDMAFSGPTLFLSTQGRAFWALDDLSVLRQAKAGMEKSSVLFKPADAYRSGLGPAAINYYLAEAPKGPVRIEILDAKGAEVATFTGRPGAEEAPAPTGGGGGGGGGFGFGGAQPRVGTRPGFNRFLWNMRYGSLFEIPRGAVLWAAGGNAGPKVVPGTYQVKITAGAFSQTQSFEVRPDPRIKTTAAEYDEQLKLARDVGGQIKELYTNLARIRDVKQQATQLGERIQRAGKGDDVAKAAKALSDRFGAVEGKLTQLQGEGGQDALNFPGQLDNQFLVLYGAVSGPDSKPAPHHLQRFEELKPQLTRTLGDLKQVMDSDLTKFNELVRSKGLAAVILGS